VHNINFDLKVEPATSTGSGILFGGAGAELRISPAAFASRVPEFSIGTTGESSKLLDSPLRVIVFAMILFIARSLRVIDQILGNQII
jgi:hypothetical protein